MNAKKAAIAAAVGCFLVGGAVVVVAGAALLFLAKGGEAPSLSSVLPGIGGEGPASAVMRADRINGLFYMQRYWMATRHLEKAVWYFAPDGRAYRNPEGVDAASLARVAAVDKGRWEAGGGTMSVAWENGKTSRGRLEVKPDGFNWDAGIFVPVEAFASAEDLVGRYEGGTSMSFGGGTSAASRSLELHPDGSYEASGIATMRTSGVTAGSQGGDRGRWRLDGWQLTLTPETGAPATGLVFPLDDDETMVKPDRMFYRGINYKKQAPSR